jgi:hypothetical protein
MQGDHETVKARMQCPLQDGLPLQQHNCWAPEFIVMKGMAQHM